MNRFTEIKTRVEAEIEEEKRVAEEAKRREQLRVDSIKVKTDKAMRKLASFFGEIKDSLVDEKLNIKEHMIELEDGKTMELIASNTPMPGTEHQNAAIVVLGKYNSEMVDIFACKFTEIDSKRKEVHKHSYLNDSILTEADDGFIDTIIKDVYEDFIRILKG